MSTTIHPDVRIGHVHLNVSSLERSTAFYRDVLGFKVSINGPTFRDSAVDHGGTVALYLRDPDGTGIELTYDLPRSEWYDANGNLIVKAEPFDWRELLEPLATVS